MPALTHDEREQFLRQPGILCRVASLRPDGAPSVTPCWYIYDEGAIWITPRAESTWLANLRRDPRIALAIDEEAHPYRKVVVEGVAELAYDIGQDDEWRGRYRRICLRYVPPAGAERYITETIDQPRALFRIPLEGSKVQTWRMPRQGEDFRGIWHDRYYVPGSKLAQ
ncbi:MAG: pyridoxamine 5'-phosphate oxidase family protein [Dehalococcoidia bacterium]|nr:pyridoxamine 5'-phosphate oxidase family protein [Dehalococcoidia bacterium]